MYDNQTHLDRNERLSCHQELLTNHPELSEDCGVYDPALSDHGLVYGFLNETVKHQKGKIVTFRSLKNFDVEKYKEDLMYALWHVSEIFSSCDGKFYGNAPVQYCQYTYANEEYAGYGSGCSMTCLENGKVP